MLSPAARHSRWRPPPFLAVYREGFETVLFFKALFVSPRRAVACRSRCGHAGRAGCTRGGVHRDRSIRCAAAAQNPSSPDQRVPLLHGVRLRRQSVAELQEGGTIGTTVTTWAPRIPLSASIHRRIAGGTRRPGAARRRGAGVDLRSCAPRQAVAVPTHPSCSRLRPIFHSDSAPVTRARHGRSLRRVPAG